MVLLSLETDPWVIKEYSHCLFIVGNIIYNKEIFIYLYVLFFVKDCGLYI